MSKKLQNIRAVQKMLDGTHAFQTKRTHGFSDAKQSAEKNQKHKIGDKWEEDINGTLYVIEQFDGFRVKKPKNSIAKEVRSYLSSFPKCPKDTCTCIHPNRLDNKMKVYHQMCFDCVIDMEHELRKTGKYEEYEQNRIKNNAEAWLVRAENDVKMIKKAYTEASTVVMNADGLLENWAAKMTPEEFEETIENGFIKFKEEFRSKLNDEPNENS